MISLSGKKLHSKRNFLNRFKENYSYTYESITPESAKECAFVARKWCEKKECESKGSMKNELTACETALYNMEELGLVTPAEGNKPRKLLPAAQGYLDHVASLDGEEDGIDFDEEGNY